MATYAIGDIQGCFDSLTQLLDRIAFDAAQDRLCLVGDLVNRGPKSLQVLRWARSLGERVVAVLGNHDLHLLLRAAGLGKKKRLDTLDPILSAPDCVELVEWLRHRPLVHLLDDYVIVHAGLHPNWSAEQAADLALEVAEELRAPDWHVRIGDLVTNAPPPWQPSLSGVARLQAITSVVSRLRVCTPEGRLAPRFTGPPDAAPAGYMPWYAVPGARWRTSIHSRCVVFGHWSALGLYRDQGCIGLDTGCVWGGALTALRLEDRRVTQVSAAEPRGI